MWSTFPGFDTYFEHWRESTKFRRQVRKFPFWEVGVSSFADVWSHLEIVPRRETGGFDGGGGSVVDIEVSGRVASSLRALKSKFFFNPGEMSA